MENNQKEKENIENMKEQNVVPNNDPVFNEIQEILMDQEMIQKKLIESNEENYKLELTFPSELILKKFNVKFLLIIPKEYPKKEPELYCITIFTHPHICDGRNLINDIINREWTYENNIPIDFIINKIPKFIIKYSDYTDKSLIIGKYMINHLYPFNFLKSLPIFFHLIPETNKIITIGDISLCLLELDNEKESKYCKLTFFVNIKEIIEIQTKQKNNLIIIKYKSEKSTKKININSEKYNIINDILLEKMKIYKKKLGKIPDIDIKYLEKEIEEKEKELLNKDNKNIIMYKEKCLRLMDIYQQAIEYYSAVNNPKFIDINIKIHQLIENQLLTLNPETKEKENINNTTDKTNKKEEIKNENTKIQENKDNKKINENKDEIKIKENLKEDKKEEKNNKKEEKEKKEIKRKEEENKKNKETKEQKDENGENTQLRLQINEGELNTLDVGEDDEEEEDEK